MHISLFNSKLMYRLINVVRHSYLVIAMASVRLPCSCFSWYLDLKIQKYIQVHPLRKIKCMTKANVKNLHNAFGDISLSLISEVHVWHLDLIRFLLMVDGCWYLAILNNKEDIILIMTSAILIDIWITQSKKVKT